MVKSFFSLGVFERGSKCHKIGCFGISGIRTTSRVVLSFGKGKTSEVLKTYRYCVDLVVNCHEMYRMRIWETMDNGFELYSSCNGSWVTYSMSTFILYNELNVEMN